MSLPTEAIDPTKGIRFSTSGSAEEAQVPGTLSKWQNADASEAWRFVGNGVVTSTQFVRTVVEREADSGQQECAHVTHDNDFHRMAAVTLLHEECPDHPIPEGKVKELHLKALVAMIGPFLKSYAKRVAEQETLGDDTGLASESDLKRWTGNVQSHGITLPIGD